MDCLQPSLENALHDIVLQNLILAQSLSKTGFTGEHDLHSGSSSLLNNFDLRNFASEDIDVQIPEGIISFIFEKRSD